MKLYNVEGYAELIGVSKSRIRQLIAANILPVKKIGNQNFIVEIEPEDTKTLDVEFTDTGIKIVKKSEKKNNEKSNI